MDIVLDEEKINQILEQAARDHIKKVMNIFQRDYYQQDNQFDPRLMSVVKDEVRRIIQTEMRDMIIKSCLSITHEMLAKTVVDELRNRMDELNYE